MKPTTRTALTHVGTAAGGAMAAAFWLASKSVDLYAIFDQFNKVATEVMTLIATVTPIVTGAYAVYKATTKNKIADLEKSGVVEGVVVNDPVLAQELGPKVQTTASALPIDAQIGPQQAMGGSARGV